MLLAGALERAGFALADLAHTRAAITRVETRMIDVLDQLGLTSLAVSIPGMSWAIGKLQELTGSELTMSVSPWQTAALCAVVLVLELAAVALCSALAARRGIRKAA